MRDIYHGFLAFLSVIFVLLPSYAACSAEKSLVVAGKDFTEQVLLLELTRQLLVDRGYKIEKLNGLTTAQLHQHMVLGTADIYWEYTSTRLILTYGQTSKLSEEEGLIKIRELDGRNNYIWLKASRVNNKYALAMTSKKANSLGISRISDLAKHLHSGENIKFGFNDEFAERIDGLDPLRKDYGLVIPDHNIANIESDRIYNALRVFWIDVGVVFSTDGRIVEYGLKLLEDDRQFFYNYILVPVVKKETIESHPELAGVLENLSGCLDNTTMTRLNAEADIGRRLVRDVASDFLKQCGLIRR